MEVLGIEVLVLLLVGHWLLVILIGSVLVVDWLLMDVLLMVDMVHWLLTADMMHWLIDVLVLFMADVVLDFTVVGVADGVDLSNIMAYRVMKRLLMVCLVMDLNIVFILLLIVNLGIVFFILLYPDYLVANPM